MRKLIPTALFALWTTFASAQPAPVPALPDTTRVSTYSISGTTCACAVNFQLYGDGTDVDNWIQVFIGSTQVLSSDPSKGWVLTSPSGSIGAIARPITDAILTFNAVQTGQVTILGAQRPRRLSEFSENAGIPARNHNQVLNTLFAEGREHWDQLGRTIKGQPGEVLNLLPPAASRSGGVLAFDGSGQPIIGIGAPLAVPFTESLTVSSNLATVAGFGFNPIAIGLRTSSDNASCTCPTPGQNLPTLLTVEETMGGSSINNGRNAFSAFLNLTSATSATNPYRFYVAGNFYANASSADNGTGGTPAGEIEAITGASQLQSGATNYTAQITAEFDISTNSGASVRQRAALLLAEWPSDAVHGSVVDTWIWTFGSTGGVGMNTGWQIDANGGVFALSSAATVIKLVSAYTITTGFDFGTGTVSGNVLQWASSAYSLAGNGTATLANLLFPSGLVSVGTCTGIGSTGSCAMATGSSRQRGKVVLTSAGTGQSTAGALTLTFTGALGPNDSSCQFFPQNGTGAWASTTTMQGQVSSTTSAVAIWISAVAPVAGNNYLVEYSCGGI